MDLIVRLLGGIGIAIPCGLNPYLPLLILSVGARGDRLTLNPDFQFLNSWAALIILAILVGVDVFADKLPQVENLYRGINLLACPIAGGIAFAAMTPNDVIPSAVSFIIGLVAAEIMHLVKSWLRQAITLSKSNVRLFEPVISMGEDFLVAFLTIIALALPVAGGPLSLLTLGAYYWWFNGLKRRKPAAKSRVQ